MNDLETVGGTIEMDDPLYAKQKEDVARMRASLLACTIDANKTKQALENIVVLRIYHQVSRIIRYLDLMDKLEDKLYKSIEKTVTTADDNSHSTWVMLLGIQERLQKNMIESQKLLGPYMSIEDFKVFDLVCQSDDTNSTASIIPSDERDKIRIKAQTVLKELEGS